MTFFGTSKPRISFRTTRIREASIATPNDVNDSEQEAIVAKALSKKPAASIASLYLRAATANQYGKVLTLPATKDNWPEYERLNTLSARLRRKLGFSISWPLGFAAACCALAFVAGRYAITSNRFSYGNPSGAPGGDTLQILKRFDSRHYQMRWVQRNTTFHVSACDPLPLSAGQTLLYFAYQETDTCMDSARFLLQRDSLGKPTLAPNCFVNDRDMTECKPNQMEARF